MGLYGGKLESVINMVIRFKVLFIVPENYENMGTHAILKL